MNFNGITGMENLFMLSDAKTRSICPENFSGEAGGGARCPVEKGNAAEAAKDLGTGWLSRKRPAGHGVALVSYPTLTGGKDKDAVKVLYMPIP